MSGDLEYSVSIAPTVVRGDPVVLLFELTNVGAEEYALLTWGTPFEDLALDFVEVRRGDTAIPYDGILIRRGEPVVESYRRVAPGETVAATVDLTAGFAFEQPGTYTVTLPVEFADAIPAPDPMLTPRAPEKWQGLALGSASASFELDPGGEVVPTAGERVRADADVAAGAVAHPQVLAAHESGLAWVKAGLACIETWSTAEQNRLSKEWFGAPDQARYYALRDRLTKIVAGMTGPHYYLDAAPSSCGVDSIAHTNFLGMAVYLCPKWFKLPLSGEPTTGFAVLVHEWAHASGLADDGGKSNAATALAYAKQNPEGAVKSAYCIEYFTRAIAENMLTSPVQWPDGRFYFFVAGRYYSVDPSKTAALPPDTISRGWPGLWPDRVDAGVVWPNGKAYFFRDDKYMRIDVRTKQPESAPTPIAAGWPGLNLDGVDAAFVWPDNTHAYFFRGSQCWRWNIEAGVPPGYPRPIRDEFPNLWERGITGALTWNASTVYLFRGWDYMRLRTSDRQIDTESLRPIGENWPGIWRDRVDAAVNDPDGRTYFVRGSEVRGYNHDKGEVDVRTTIAARWNGIWPDRVDAVVHVPSKGKIFFFRDSEYMQFDVFANRADPGYPKPLSYGWPGVNTDKVDAAVLAPGNSTYLFRGSRLWIWDNARDVLGAGPVPISSYLRAISDDPVDAGFLDPKRKKMFLFRGGNFWRYDFPANRADPDHPRPIGPNWPNLPNRLP
ncbi:MAG TPA: hemopexin repeat-containing protein [Solirubrobacterales bacterium]